MYARCAIVHRPLAVLVRQVHGDRVPARRRRLERDLLKDEVGIVSNPSCDWMQSAISHHNKDTE
jgi:hypothetical protein